MKTSLGELEMVDSEANVRWLELAKNEDLARCSSIVDAAFLRPLSWNE